MFDYCLIMAGGSGTRLWPASNSKNPKQFLPITKGNKDTFFSQSLERALKIIDKKSGKVIVITGKTHIQHILDACLSLNPEDKKRLLLIPEPEAKNTAPAIACAIAYSRKTGSQNGSMLVITSDHIIKPITLFRKNAKTAWHFALQDHLVMLGIRPNRPETGYGYIKTGKKFNKDVYVIESFKEKPNLETARKLIASNIYFWNSGMFAFKYDFVMEEYLKHADKVIMPFEQLSPPGEEAYKKHKGIKILENWEGLESAYRQTENISFDIAITEKCTNAVMIQAEFDWIDVGDWDEYARLLSNNKIGKKFISDDVYSSGTCEECFIDSDIPVGIAGIDNLIVVIRSGKDGSPPAALIVKKGETQKVRDIVEKIKQSGRKEIL